MARDTSTSRLIPQWWPGDKEELDRILKNHLPWIQGYVHKKLNDFRRSKADTNDIVQEALIQFLRHGPRVRLKNDKQFRALLCKIVENVVCNKYDWFTARRRDLSRERPLPPDSILDLDPPEGKPETPSKIIQKQEEEAWARLGLELLEPKDREVIILRQWEDLSFTAIGKMLDLSKAGARKRYFKALNVLIKIVESLQRGQLNSILEPELFGETDN